MIEHQDIPASRAHEPKGADVATNGTLYVFNGSGSGSIKKISTDNIDQSSIQNINRDMITLTLDISGVSTLTIPLPRLVNISYLGINQNETLAAGISAELEVLLDNSVLTTHTVETNSGTSTLSPAASTGTELQVRVTAVNGAIPSTTRITVTAEVNYV